MIRKPLWAINTDSTWEIAPDINDNQSTLTAPTIGADAHEDSPLLFMSNSERKELHRHLSLFDLVCVGVGSTIGSGIYVLCGLIANKYAGPATFLSWGIAGGAACLSGVCYAELAGKIPSAGSVYVYAYTSIGELPAVLAAACLTLEYVGSASAVARSWGDKIIEWLHEESSPMEKYLNPGFGFNPMAFLVSFVSTLLLLKGVKESKSVTNFFTSFSVCLVLSMAFGGLILLQKKNLTPLIPPQYGMAGVFRGATSSFFGYIGYDEICCIAGEAINPRKNLPRAVILTLILVTVLYMCAALALTGMQPYQEISTTSGFPDAFRWNHLEWAAQLAAAGELLALPSVVLITIMAQPRLQFALARDGLLPSLFGEIDSKGNLWNGALISGTVMTLISTFVPFRYLNDLISSGILVAFTMTNWALVSLRCDFSSPPPRSYLLEYFLSVFNVVAFATGILLTHAAHSILGKILACAGCLIMIAIMCIISSRCCRDPNKIAYGISKQRHPNYAAAEINGDGYFEIPGVPYLPCIGMFLNWYLVAQMEMLGILLLVLYLTTASLVYFCYGAKHSIGNTIGWRQQS